MLWGGYVWQGVHLVAVSRHTKEEQTGVNETECLVLWGQPNVAEKKKRERREEKRKHRQSCLNL